MNFWRKIKVINPEKDINTFQKLISKYNICIPIIQRDYIQGIDDREFKCNEKFKISDKKEKFLEKIFIHLDNDSYKVMNINIIYGFIGENDEYEKKIFFPVDGQQRLTTLYLLHWYLYIRNSNKDDFKERREKFEKGIFTYETRESAKDFFRFLNDVANKSKILKLFDTTETNYEEMCCKNKELSFVRKVQNQSWFKSQWFTDTTIISAINIIGDFYCKIPETKLDDYLKKLVKGDRITFHLIINKDENAENLASVDYIRLNSRGKQLEFFENLKPLLEQFNEKVYDEVKSSFARSPSNFVFNYDRRYIDIFYDTEKNKDLKSIQKNIDKNTMIVMINLYNIFRYINKKKYPNLSKCLNQEEFYQIVYQHSKLEFSNQTVQYSLKQFWKEYFEFLNFILDTIKEHSECKKYLKRLFVKEENDSNTIIEDIDLYNEEIGKKKTGNLVIYLRYLYWYFKENKKIDKKDSHVIIQKLKQLKYFLRVLRYDEWKEEYYENTELFARCVAKREYENVNGYFLKKDSREVIAELKINNIKGINDIKVRIKELCVKAKLINYINKNIDKFKDFISGNIDYKFFEELEERLIQKNRNEKYSKRSVYYLLYIAELWESEISDEKIRKILCYKEAAEKYFLKSENKLEWRKIFAIAVYYNEMEGELLSPDKINKIGGRPYKLGQNENAEDIVDSHNLHYWDDTYYFIDDKITKKDMMLREMKLKKLRLSYDLDSPQQCKIDSISTLKEKLREADYDSCWLKYAISSDNDHEELLINNMVFRNNKVEIEREIRSLYTYLNSEKRYENFFAYLYILAKEKDKWKVDIHESWVYDLTTTNVRDTKYRQNYTLYYDVVSSKIINGFELKLLWQGQKERQLYDRTFFYHKHILKIDGDSDTLISVEDNKIVKKIFKLNDYKEYHYNFEEDKKNIEEKIKEENKQIGNIEKLYNEYLEIKKKNNEKILNLRSQNIVNATISLEITRLEKEIKVSLNKFEGCINKNYSCKKSYSRNESIKKYLYKESIEKTIWQDEFIEKI
jgi:hypothetical protein